LVDLFEGLYKYVAYINIKFNTRLWHRIVYFMLSLVLYGTPFVVGQMGSKILQT